MRLEPTFPDLKIITANKIRLHEEHDPIRVERLVRSLNSSRILRNPPVVTKHDGFYIILDGVSRSLAFMEMGIPHIAVQIVHDIEHSVCLKTWNHVIVGLPADRLLCWFQQIPGLNHSACTPKELSFSLANRHSLFGVIIRDGDAYSFQGNGSSVDPAQCLCQVVATYRGRGEVFRTVDVELSGLRPQYPDMSAIVLFPHFQTDDVIRAALDNARLPMGITRHLIQGRVLGLNFPLKLLEADSSLEEKNMRLQKMVEERLRVEAVRLYPEATFVFDDVDELTIRRCESKRLHLKPEVG